MTRSPRGSDGWLSATGNNHFCVARVIVSAVTWSLVLIAAVWDESRQLVVIRLYGSSPSLAFFGPLGLYVTGQAHTRLVGIHPTATLCALSGLSTVCLGGDRRFARLTHTQCLLQKAKPSPFLSSIFQAPKPKWHSQRENKHDRNSHVFIRAFTAPSRVCSAKRPYGSTRERA